MDIPVYYRAQNLASASREPAGVVLENNDIARFYARYLLKRAMAAVKFTLPESWDAAYFAYTMFCRGFGAVLEYPGLGVIFQGGTVYGRDVYYQPRNFRVANPVLKELDLPIYRHAANPKCVLLKLQPDYSGVLDIVHTFANRIALAYEAWTMNTQNSKLAYVGFFSDKALAKSFEELFDRVQAGRPAVAVGKELQDDDGNPRWAQFTQDLKGSYIAPDISEDIRRLLNEFDSFVGIPNNPDALKKERSIVAGVESNNVETDTILEQIVETLSAGFRDANKFFGSKLPPLKAEKRYPLIGGDAGEDQLFNPGTV